MKTPDKPNKKDNENLKNEEKNLPPLSKRLKAVEEMCLYYSSKVYQPFRIYDIGCDHALLALHLASNDSVKHIIASDNKEGPLAAARANLAAYPREAAKIKTVLADGLPEGISLNYDMAVMAGMGGIEIIKILEKADLKSGSLVLQANSHFDLLRLYLNLRRGMCLSEKIVYDAGKYYFISLYDLQNFKAPLFIRDYDRLEEELYEIADFLKKPVSFPKLVLGNYFSEVLDEAVDESRDQDARKVAIEHFISQASKRAKGDKRYNEVIYFLKTELENKKQISESKRINLLRKGIIMPDIATINAFIEEQIPPETAEEWDPAGFQLGFPERKCDKIVLSLDFDAVSLEKALLEKAQLIITHHPYIFTPLKTIKYSSRYQALIIEALKNNISLISTHTAWDKHRDGVASALALEVTSALEKSEIAHSGIETCDNPYIKYITPERNTDFKKSLNFINNLCEALNSDLYLREDSELFNRYRPILHKIGDTSYDIENYFEIQRIAIAPGAFDESFLPEAVEGCNILITGEIKHHLISYLASAGVLVLPLGHRASETPSLKPLKELLAKRFPSIEYFIV